MVNKWCWVNKWYRNFRLRHNLTNAKAENIDCGRSKMGNVMVWKQHFDLLQDIVDKIGLKSNSKSIFNCIKSMVAMDRGSGTVVVSRKTEHTYSGGKGTKDHITVSTCVSASGFIMPSHKIFSQASIRSLYCRWT